MRGPMSTPIQPSSMASLGTTSSSASSAKRSATSTSTGSCSPQLSLTACSISSAAIAWPASSSCSDAPDPLALRGEEREAHRPADQHAVAALEQAPDQRQLVAHLAAAEHRDEGAFGLGHQALEHLDLAREQEPGAGRQQAGDALGRGVGAVGRAEGVVHVVGEARRRAARRRPGRWPPRPRGSAGSRASRARPGASRPTRSPHLAGRRSPAAARRSRPISSPRRSAQGRSDSSGRRCPLGRPRCEQTATPAPACEQPLERRDRGADARVVGDAAVLERDVEVGAHQHARAAPVDPRIVDPEEAGGHRSRRGGRARPARPPGTSSPTRCRTRRSA